MLYFDLEIGFPLEDWAPFVKNWYFGLLVPAAIYYWSLKKGQEFMSTREPINVKRFLIAWNLFLTIFSIFGAHRIYLEVEEAIKVSPSLLASVCVPRILTPRGGFWSCLFALSKFVEFGDTFFLVVKKKPVIFLHWYHHITVMLLAFHTWATLHPIARFFGFMNFFVHSFMYGYFTLTAIGFRIHPNISLAITSLQLSQMFFGLLVTLSSLRICPQKYDKSSAFFALTIYTSYAFLFAHFMYKSYFKKSRQSTNVEHVKESESRDVYGTMFRNIHNHSHHEIKGSKNL